MGARVGFKRLKLCWDVPMLVLKELRETLMPRLVMLFTEQVLPRPRRKSTRLKHAKGCFLVKTSLPRRRTCFCFTSDLSRRLCFAERFSSLPVAAPAPHVGQPLKTQHRSIESFLGLCSFLLKLFLPRKDPDLSKAHNADHEPGFCAAAVAFQPSSHRRSSSFGNAEAANLTEAAQSELLG